MPKIEIVRHISGSRDGAEWPGVGEIVDVPEEEASDLIRLGVARGVAGKKEPEKAVAPKGETRGGKGLTKGSTGL